MKERIEYLEGLRGIAACIVVLHHYFLAFYPASFTKNLAEIHTGRNLEALLYNTPLGILIDGNFAVQIFFILSGLVLTLQYIESNKSNEVLAKTSLKRYFRLLPSVLFCNLLVYILLINKLNFNVAAAGFTQSTWWLKGFWPFAPNLLDVLKQSFLGMFSTSYPQSYNPALWVIAYFFLGTFLVTGILSLFGKLEKRYLIYAILFAALLNTYFYPFIIGIILGELFFGEQKLRNNFNRWDVGLLFILGIYFGSYPIFTATNLLEGTIYDVLPTITLVDSFGLYHAIGAAMIIVSLFLSKPLQKIFSWKPFVFIGNISYSLYIFHIIVIATLSSYLFVQFYNSFGYNKSFLLMALISFPFILLCSYRIHRFIEKRGEGLAGRFYTYLSSK